MKHSHLILTAILIIFLLIFSACSENSPNAIEICKEDSMLVEYYEDGGVVHFICEIVLVNHSSTEQTVKLYGFSQEDVEGGLLLNPNLTGYNIENQSDTFHVNSNSRCKLTVDFRGEYAGVLQKADRRIPDVLEIEIME